MKTTDIIDADLRDAIQRGIDAAAAGDLYNAALALETAMSRAHSLAYSANFSAGMEAGRRIYGRAEDLQGAFA